MSHEKQWKNAGLFLLQVSIVIINTILFAAIWYAYYKGQMWGTTFYRKGDYLLVLLYLCLSGVMTKLYGGVDLKTSRISELIYSHVVAIFITNALMYIVILLLTRRPKSILPPAFGNSTGNNCKCHMVIYGEPSDKQTVQSSRCTSCI